MNDFFAALESAIKKIFDLIANLMKVFENIGEENA